MPNLLERCLFFSTSEQIIQKICHILLSAKSLQICLPLFWSRTCTADFYVTAKNSNSSVEKSKHSSSDFTRLTFDISKSVWQHLFQKQITIPAEYLPSSLKIKTYWESQHVVDKSEWKNSKSQYFKNSFTYGVTDRRYLKLKNLPSTIPLYNLETRSHEFRNRKANRKGIRVFISCTQSH